MADIPNLNNITEAIREAQRLAAQQSDFIGIAMDFYGRGGRKGSSTLVPGYIDYTVNKEKIETKAQVRHSPAGIAERERIEAQRDSPEYNREDKFSIGTVCLKIPPAQIAISENAHNFRIDSMRSHGETIYSSGLKTTQIDLDIYFSGLDDINNKLRVLLAQFKTTPFLPIENSHLRNVMDPFGTPVSLVSQAQERETQLERISEIKKELADVLRVTNDSEINKNKFYDLMEKFRQEGSISNEDYRVLIVTGINNIDKLPRSFVQESDFADENGFRLKKIDLKKLLNRIITVPSTNQLDVVTRSRRLDEADLISKELEEINRRTAEIYAANLEKRILNKQMVGVLSQFAISTVPDFPDTLACRVVMFVFNYSPFLEDYLFIKGYDGYKPTTDITQCDMFIDWYVKKFLSGGENSLNEYSILDTLKFRYRSSAHSVSQVFESGKKVKFDEVVIGGENKCSVCSGITVSFRNKVQFLPVLSHKHATCQYLGGFNSDVQINMMISNPEILNSLSRMNDRIGSVARLNNRVGKFSFIHIKNELLQMCGMKFFVINDYDVDTVPGSPGLYEVKMNLAEYQPDAESAQKLRREGLVTQQGVILAAEFLLRKAKEFFEANPVGLSDDPRNAYRRYSTLIFDERVGWLSDSSNDIFRIYREKHSVIKSLFQPKWAELYEEIYREAAGLSSDPKFSLMRRSLDVISERVTALAVFFDGILPFPFGSESYSIQGRDLKSGYDGLVRNEYITFNGEKRKFGVRNKEVATATSGIAFIHFSDNFLRSARGGDITEGEQSFFNKHFRLVAKILAFTRRDEIVQMLLDPANNSELYEYVYNKNTRDREDIRKKYCYPDLLLPTYEEIGEFYRVTYREAGIQPPSEEELTSTPQVIADEVDPDFYMYKYKFWSNVIDSDSSLGQGLTDGLDSYKRLVNENKLFRAQESLDEVAFSRKLETDNYDISENTPDTPDKDDLRTLLQGKPLTVTRVIDGDTFVVAAPNGSRSYHVRLNGIDTPELNLNKPGVPPEPGAFESLGALSSILLKQGNAPDSVGSDSNNSRFHQVKLYFGRDVFDSTESKRLLADVIIDAPGGERINVTNKMLSIAARKGNLNLRSYDFLNNDMALAYEESFYENLTDVFVRERTAERFNTTAYKVLDATPNFLGPALGPVVSKIATSAIRTGWSLTNSFVKGKDAKSSVVEAIYEGIKGLTEFSVGEAASSAFDSSVGIPFKRSANDVVANIFQADKNKNNLQRFDRSADDHISAIAHKIRLSQKDDLLRVSRAFPTYRIYFIEEDSPEWGLLNDLYSYDAVVSIDVTRSRSDPVDGAVIKFLNTKGVLDSLAFQEEEVKRVQKESFARDVQDTIDEQDDLSSFILKAGTRIQIKMGYSSDPDLLDTVFNGVVAEVSGGDMVTVVAQGYGYQLLNNAGDNYYTEKTAATYKILDKLMNRPELFHFGRWKLVPEQTHITKTLGRRPQFRGGEFRHPSWWRNLGFARYFLEFRQNISDDNIWTPEQSWWYNLTHGGSQKFVVSHQTIWDVFQEMSRRMPGFIAMPMLFDERATMYFGPADFLYWASDKHSYLRRESLFSYNKAVQVRTVDKVESFFASKGLTYQVATDAQVLGALNLLAQLLNRPENKSARKQSFSTITAFTSIGNKKPYEEAHVNFFKTVIASQINDKDEVGHRVAHALDALIAHATKGGNYLIKTQMKYPSPTVFSANVIFSIAERKLFQVDRDEFYIDNKGNIYSEKQITDLHEAKARQTFFNDYPDMKLVREYHYKDSIHHIMRNTISASEQYFNNKVTIEWGKQSAWKGNKLAGTFGGPERLSIQADDSIWPERIRENIVQEKNAGDIVTAWTYALGNMQNEMRKMYMGELTMLGDSSIKPYDIIFINDYYTDMFGPIEVERVTHNFSPDTGFVTTITPNLLCYVSNVMSVGNVILAGAYMDVYTKKVLEARAAVAIASFGLLSNLTSRIHFAITRGSRSRREPVAFSPLIYAGKPYVAGIEGLRRSAWYETFLGKVSAFRNKYLIEGPSVIRAVGEYVSARVEEGSI